MGGKLSRSDGSSRVTGLNWTWIVVAATVPLIAGILLAVPFWRGGQPILGNVAGTAVMFGAAIGLILREYTELDRITRQCLEDGIPCFPDPSAFTRFAIYAFIGLAEVFILFSISLRAEEKNRRRDYAPEWR
jgi:hypothetical protein